MKQSSFAILFEDNWLLAVDKPAGLLTIPARGKNRSLTGLLNQDLLKRNVSYRLHPCHRLDRETSGVILYAKGKAAQKKMMELFKQKQVKKSYVAFVHGRLPKEQGTINHPIEGQSALTHYTIIQQKEHFSVAEIIPFTGRKNQIRIHFKGIGHPLVGESKFAFRKDFALKAKRAFLHAAKISFKHPFTGAHTSISSGLSGDMKQFLAAHA